MGGLFRTSPGQEAPKLPEDMVSKMQAVLEDTLLKNFQLRTRRKMNVV